MKALILCGDGINCEKETAEATTYAGFRSQIMHVNDLLSSRGKPLADTSLLVLPGGFSFGDELGSGKILALKLKHGLSDALQNYIAKGGAVFGICNGFQVLTRLGVFGPNVVLTQNEQGHFINRWVGLEIIGKSIFTQGLLAAGYKRLELPIRHGEGRLVVESEEGLAAAGAEPVLSYETDVNGSWKRTAALSSHDGRVFGLMPHPEAYWTESLHPWGEGRKVPLGLKMFESAFSALQEGRGK